MSRFTANLSTTSAPIAPSRVRWGGAVLLGAACVVTSLSAAVTKNLTTRYSAPALASIDRSGDDRAAGGARAPRGDLGPIVDPMWSGGTGAPAGVATPSSGGAEAAGWSMPEGVTLDARLRYFDGRPVRPVGTMVMKVTAYSPDARSCGLSADGITASNHAVETNAFRLVAADSKVLPLGSIISVPGYDEGRLVPVLDRGGAIKGQRLDVLFPTHEQARKWGVRNVEVTIYEYADGGANAWRKVRDSRK